MKRFTPTSPIFPINYLAGIEDIVMTFSPGIEHEHIIIEDDMVSANHDEEIIIDEVVASIGHDNKEEDYVIDDLAATYFK